MSRGPVHWEKREQGHEKLRVFIKVTASSFHLLLCSNPVPGSSLTGLDSPSAHL